MAAAPTEGVWSAKEGLQFGRSSTGSAGPRLLSVRRLLHARFRDEQGGVGRVTGAEAPRYKQAEAIRLVIEQIEAMAPRRAA